MTLPNDNKEIAMAKRCQLLTGSFDGNESRCPCEKTGDCQISPIRREILKNEEVIKERVLANIKYYNSLNPGKTLNDPS